ncbi:MAG: GNAT family N-acetyltransferase [Anaerolineaceae bacterium]|nr:GNAT family N-acetyltransferase [Anaerolineaceae bacterium]
MPDRLYMLEEIDKPKKADHQFFERKLAEFNKPWLGEDDMQDFILCARENNSGDVIAGLSAVFYYGVVSIDFLWVAEDWRGRGVGTALMEAVEQNARDRGCRFIHLNTFDFQAPGFYSKLGYEEWGKLDDYPNQVTRHYFRKRLLD